MYLKRLVEFAEENQELFPTLGYKHKKYHWIVNVTGNEFHFLKANRGDEKILPDVTRSSGTKPILLVDKADYVFGFASTDASEKIKKRALDRQEAYLALLEECVEATQNQSVAMILKLLRKPIINFPDNVKENDYFIFRVNDDEFPHENKEIQLFWETHLKPSVKSEDEMQCMVCGEFGAVMDRHSIVFPLGPERTKMISANANAYESHNLKASRGAPTCYVCEQKYGQALEHLLQRHHDTKQPGGPHMFRMTDLTYVYWLRKKEHVEGLSGLISLSTSNPNEVRELIQST